MDYERNYAREYILSNFQPTDRLAVVVVSKGTGAVTQRIGTAERIASPEFQTWLRYENARGREIYLSMNALKPDAQSRTKNDIGAVRHIYLDLDRDGEATASRLIRSDELPMPNFVVNTSLDKRHVIWCVEGFTRDAAEHLQRSLAREWGGDLAATDCARVLRLPGFFNHKYNDPHWVRIDPTVVNPFIHGPEAFPEFPQDRPSPHAPSQRHRSLSSSGTGLSQSERDWAYAKRALSRGEPVASIIAAIAEYRHNEKPNPEYYAAHTVGNAAAALAHEQLRALDLPAEPER